MVKLLEVDWSPEPGKLRTFAIAFAAFAAVVGAWLRLSAGVPMPVSLVVWAAGAAVLLAGLLLPPAVRPVYVVLTAVALPIGLVLSTLILGVVYFLLLTPIGLTMRLLGRDPMLRKPDPDAGTYWRARAGVEGIRRYFRQS